MSRTLVPLGYSVSENESGEDGASGIARDDDCAGLDSVGVRCFVQECPGVTGLVDLGRIALDGDLYGHWLTCVASHFFSNTNTCSLKYGIVTGVLVEALEEAVAAIDGSEAGGFRVDGLEELVRLGRLLDRVQGAWLVGLEEAARMGTCESVAGLSTTEWVAQECGRTTRDAGGAVRLAKRVALTGLVQERLLDGSLSLGRASLFAGAVTQRTRKLFAEFEESLLLHSDRLHADQLQFLLSQWRRRADAVTDRDDRKDVEDRREVFLSSFGDGEWDLKGTLTPEQGALLSQALMAIAQAEWDGKDDPRTVAQRRADALASLAQRFLNSNGTVPGEATVTVHGQRPQLIVTISLADLASTGPDAAGFGVTPEGVTLDRATVQTVACDAVLSAVLMQGPNVVHSGRTTRTIPGWVRRDVLTRDRHCRYPGCCRPAAWCECHHIRHWAHGGSHDPGNVVLLCGRHHHRVHRLGEILVLHPDGRLDVTTAMGLRTSRPPPGIGDVAASAGPRPDSPLEQQRRAREREAVAEAISRVHAAARWDRDDHRIVESIRQRLADDVRFFREAQLADTR